VCQASVFSSSANEELHALRDLEGVPGLLDGPHHCQQFTVLSTANNLTCFEDPSLWLVIIDHEYVQQLLINVRPVVVEDEDKAKLTLIVYLEQMVGVSDVEHHRTHHMVFVLGLHMVGGLLNNRSNALLDDLVELIGLKSFHRVMRRRCELSLYSLINDQYINY
jgi:hypothetical protein